MKEMAFLALIISLLLIFSCTESGEITTTDEDEITSVYLGKSAVDLRLKLFKNKESQNEIDPEIALSGIIELYIESCLDSSSADKPINIYVLYDTGIWDENDEQETFQITMAYQSVENGDLYESSVAFTYDPADFEHIKKFDARFDPTLDKFSDLKKFRNTVKSSPGFKKSLSVKPLKIEVIKELV